MDYNEFKKLLGLYQKQGYSNVDLGKLWQMLSDETSEEKVKSYLLEELNTFNVDDFANNKVDYENIFNGIQLKISEKEKANVVKPRKFVPSYTTTRQIFKIAAILIIVFFVGGALSYMVYNKPSEMVETYTVINAPYGARSIVSLPDGSSVWINAGSSIRYKNNFNKNTRTILLDGEAYFKVAKNKKIPFIVNTGGIDIVAVGTEFNVKSYNDEEFIETTLVEGKVTIRGDKNHVNNNIQQVSLEPQQKAVYMRDKKQIEIADERDKQKMEMKTAKRFVYVAKKIDPKPIIAWKDNQFIIKGEEMSSLAIKLERKYNVNISFVSKNIKKYRFTGTLEDETLTQVLDVIKLTAPIDYELQGKEVKIYENTSMMQKFNDCLKRK